MILNKVLILVGALLMSNVLWAQKTESDTILIINQNFQLVRTNAGLQMGFGLTKYHYGTKMKSWIGNHNGPSFTLQFYWRNHNWGGRFKPWTVSPRNNLDFGLYTLTSFAQLNVIKGEWFYAYDIEPLRHLIFEPFIGTLATSFLVINEDELQQQFSIKKVRGMSFGLEVKYYLTIAPFQYLIPYFSVNGAIIDYKKTHDSLDANFFAIEVGIKYGGWITKRIVVEQ